MLLGNISMTDIKVPFLCLWSRRFFFFLVVVQLLTSNATFCYRLAYYEELEDFMAVD